MSKDLFNAFADEGLSNLRIAAVDPKTGLQIFADGQDRILSPDFKYKGSSPEGVREDFLFWMKDNGFGAMIKENIHDATLTKWIEERKTKNLPLPPENLLRVTEMESVSIRKAPKSGAERSGSNE